MGLFQLGDFTLNSGAKSKWKLECDALTPEDYKALALMIKQALIQFRSVEGIPRGGLLLAKELEQYTTQCGPHLIVDDVLTTGGSMERARTKYRDFHLTDADVVGAVIFARGQCPVWILPLFTMPIIFWVKK